MSVSFNWNPREFERELKKAVEDEVRKGMDVARSAVVHARCPDHGPMEIKNRDPRTGEFEIEACCEAGAKAAERAIARALG